MKIATHDGVINKKMEQKTNARNKLPGPRRFRHIRERTQNSQPRCRNFNIPRRRTSTRSRRKINT